jgi:hypothetical protein
LVEHATENRSVGGSIPSLATIRLAFNLRLRPVAGPEASRNGWKIHLTVDVPAGRGTACGAGTKKPRETPEGLSKMPPESDIDRQS